MAYFFRSPAGTFSIMPDEADLFLYQLCIGGLWLRSFETEEEAARAVCEKRTGWADWDRREDVTAPEDLGGWEENLI